MTSPTRLYTFITGHLNVTDVAEFADDGAYANHPPVEMPIPCFLVRHPDGDLMWDAGMSPTRTDLGDWARAGPSLVDQLEAVGVTPAEVRFLSLSHGHWDHSGNAGLFAASTWIVNPDERAAMFDEESRASQAMDDYGALETADTLLISEDHDVFGDGSVFIIQAPGHTPGHTVLFVRMADAGPIILSGDLWHMAESRAGRHVPVFNTDRQQTLTSMDRVEALASATGAHVIIQHDTVDYASLPPAPEWLA